MEPDQDIRAEALLGQLNEIDERIRFVKGRHLTIKQRVLHASIAGIFVILLALSVSDLARLGFLPAIPALGLVFLLFGSGPLIRHNQTRKLARERDRVLAFYEEIDRKAGLISERKGDAG